MNAYYNDIDPKACAWLRELIAHGHIAAGVVDNRSILDIRPDELAGFTQVHFFAGIGGWSLALRWAGWPDDRPVWTGSCPCQPLSCAGQRKGHADERHLWPAFHDLIAECRPSTVFGEQVASADGREWFAGVRLDLEELGYACGGADLCAAGVGAPHRRQRLFWVGSLVHADRAGQREQCRAVAVRPQHASAQCAGGFDGMADSTGGQREQRLWPQGDGFQRPADHGATGGMADPSSLGAGRDARTAFGEKASSRGAWCENGMHGCDDPLACGATGGLADAEGGGIDGGYNNDSTERPSQNEKSDECGTTCRLGNPEGRGCRVGGDASQPGSGGHIERTGWAGFETVHCRDGKTRRFEPGSFPLAHGLPGRVGLLRGYGNAIVPQVAAEFISAFVEAKQ